jgi:hypothetical protein
MTDESRKAAFIAELTELTKKHHVAIGGCGCCNSPFLIDLAADIGWDGQTGLYISDDEFPDLSSEITFVFNRPSDAR